MLAEHYFWMCLWGRVWERLAFDSGGPRLRGWYHPIPWGPKWNTKAGERQILSLLELRCPSFPASDLRAPGSQASDPDWVPPLAFLILQLADKRLWGSSASTAIWANSYNKSHLISTYLSVPYWFCCSGAPCLTHMHWKFALLCLTVFWLLTYSLRKIFSKHTLKT